MNRTKLIAISGLCATVVVGCLVLAAYAPWAMLFLGVIASVATVIPILIDSKNLWLSLLVYLAGSVLGGFFGWTKITYIVPIVVFCIPFAIVKVFGEKPKVSATLDRENVMDDPFDDQTKIVKIRVESKTNLPSTVRWVLYYFLMEVALGLTVLSAWLFTPAVFEAAIQSAWFWIAIVLMQFAVFPYNFLMRGCLLSTVKILKKALK